MVGQAEAEAEFQKVERSRARAAAKKPKEAAALQPAEPGASRKRLRAAKGAEGPEAKEALEPEKRQRPDPMKGEAKKAARPRAKAQAMVPAAEGTPQKSRPAGTSAITATPRQKVMLARSRARLDLEEGGSPEARPPVSKAVLNYRELCAKKPFEVPEIVDGRKSFTVQPPGETGSSIG